MAYRVRDTDADGRLVTGIDLPAGRAVPGDVLDDAPAWLVAQGYVEPVEPKPRARTRKAR